MAIDVFLMGLRQGQPELAKASGRTYGFHTTELSSAGIAGQGTTNILSGYNGDFSTSGLVLKTPLAAPGSPAQGHIWQASDQLQFRGSASSKIVFDLSTSGQTIGAAKTLGATLTVNSSGGIDASGAPDGTGVVVPGSAGAPSGSNTEGCIVWDSTNDVLYVGLGGTSWQQVTSAAVLPTNTTLNAVIRGTGSGWAEETDFKVDSSGNVVDGTWQADAVGVGYGGTGRTSLALGALAIGAGGGSAMTELAAGTEGYYLKIVSGTPAWSAIAEILPTGTVTNSSLRWDGADWVENTVVLLGTSTITLGNGAGLAVLSALPDNNANALIIENYNGNADYIKISTLDAGESMDFGNATSNPAISFLGTGQKTMAGNLDVTGGLDVSGATLTTSSGFSLTSGTFVVSSSGAVSLAAGGSSSIVLEPIDNIDDALVIKVGSDYYFEIDTTNTTEEMNFGNTVTNPDYNFLGSGALTQVGSGQVTFNGNVNAAGGLDVSGADLTVGGSAFAVGTDGIVDAGTWQATSIKTGYGGTGLTSYTAGDLLYYASGTALSKLALGTSGYFLRAGASAPEWAQVDWTLAGTSGTPQTIAEGQTATISAGTGMTTTAQATRELVVAIDTAGTVSFGASAVWTFPNGVTAKGLFVTGTPVDGNHVVNKTYVDNVASGIAWKEPVCVLNLYGNVDVIGLVGHAAASVVEGLSPAEGDAYTITTADGTGALSTAAVGDIWQYVSSTWTKIVSGSGGNVPAGTYALLSTSTALISPFTDDTDDGKRVNYTGSGLAYTLTTPAAGDSYVVDGPGATWVGSLIEWSGTAYVQIAAGVGGYVPAGRRAILGQSGSVTLISPYTEATDDTKIVDFSGSSNTGSDTGDTVDGNAVLVCAENGYYENNAYVYDGTVPSGTWVQFSGAGQIVAGVGLTKTTNTINIGSGATGDINGINRTADDIALAYSSTFFELVSHQLSIKANSIGAAEIDETDSYVWSSGTHDFQNGLGISGADLDFTGANIDLDPTGAFDLNMAADQAASIYISDNLTFCFGIGDGVDNIYFWLDSTNSSESINFGHGSNTDTVDFNFLGGGDLNFTSGEIDLDPTGDFICSMDATKKFLVKVADNYSSAFEVADGESGEYNTFISVNTTTGDQVVKIGGPSVHNTWLQASSTIQLATSGGQVVMNTPATPFRWGGSVSNRGQFYDYQWGKFVSCYVTSGGSTTAAQGVAFVSVDEFEVNGASAAVDQTAVNKMIRGVAKTSVAATGSVLVQFTGVAEVEVDTTGSPTMDEGNLVKWAKNGKVCRDDRDLGTGYWEELAGIIVSLKDRSGNTYDGATYTKIQILLSPLAAAGTYIPA